MPGADGYITYSTKLDNDQLEKDLAKATKKVEKIEGELQKKQAKRLPLSEKAEELSVRLDNAKAKLAELQGEKERVSAALQNQSDPVAFMEAAARRPELERELTAAQKAVDGLQVKFDAADKKVEAIDLEIKKASADLENAQNEAGALAKELYRPATAADAMAVAAAKADRQMGKFFKRVNGLAKRVFVFSLITTALRSVKGWMGGMITANDEAAASLAQLRGALATLAQPVLNVAIPAFIALINVLTRVVTAVAGFLSLLTGSTIQNSKDAAKQLNAEADALDATGNAAKNAAKQLMGFDEINQLSDDTSATSGASAPDFSFDTSNMATDFGKLLGLIKLIGAALLSWKLSNNLTAGAKTFLGLLVAATGAIELARGAWDAWQNGLSDGNLLQMLGGAALLVAGLFIAFGNLGAGIGLVVSAIVLFISGIHDAMDVGWNFQNLMATITGMFIGGLGIYAITGSWIPLLIAAIASAVLALAVATGQGEQLLDGIRDVCQGFLDFITGIFTGDIYKALSGISQMFQGLGKVVTAVVDSFRNTLLSFLDWLDEKTGGRFHGIIELAKGLINGFFDGVNAYAGEFIDALKDIFGGLVEFIAGVLTNDWEHAWNGLKTIFKGIINGIISLFEGMVNLVIGGVNKLISGFKKLTAFELPDWMGGYKFEGVNISQIQKISIPRLATGAVIPPNREFMAVLGDQRHGNNIEAPEDLIRKIVREESGGMNTELLQLILAAIREGKVLKVNERVLAVTTAQAINKETISSGKSILLY